MMRLCSVARLHATGQRRSTHDATLQLGCEGAWLGGGHKGATARPPRRGGAQRRTRSQLGQPAIQEAVRQPHATGQRRSTYQVSLYGLSCAILW
jgi:hypothetical protein